MDARKTMKLFQRQSSYVPAEYIAQLLKLKDVKAIEDTLDALHTEGFLEKNAEGYFTTLKGSGLALASAQAPMTRAKAEAELASLMERIRQINENPEFPICVNEVVVFGSYVSDAEELSDLDIGYSTTRRAGLTQEAYMGLAQKRVELAWENGRSLSGMEQIFWPFNEVTLLLKSGRARVSLHSLENPTERGFIESKPHRVLLKA